MADLRELLDTLGYTSVATLLNSGNVVFSDAKGTPLKHAAEISKGKRLAMSFLRPAA